jgi:hypothetical protein
LAHTPLWAGVVAAAKHLRDLWWRAALAAGDGGGRARRRGRERCACLPHHDSTGARTCTRQARSRAGLHGASGGRSTGEGAVRHAELPAPIPRVLRARLADRRQEGFVPVLQRKGAEGPATRTSLLGRSLQVECGVAVQTPQGKRGSPTPTSTQVDLKTTFTSPWEKASQTWANLLDMVRYLVVWNPIIIMVTQVCPIASAQPPHAASALHMRAKPGADSSATSTTA